MTLFRRVAAVALPGLQGLQCFPSPWPSPGGRGNRPAGVQARAGAAPPGKISGTVPVVLPGGGCALPGLRGLQCFPSPWPSPGGRGNRPAGVQARAGAAPPGKISGTVPVVLPGGGYALPGLQDPLTGSHPVGPRKRSAAGQQYPAPSSTSPGWQSGQRPHQKSPALAPPAQQ